MAEPPEFPPPFVVERTRLLGFGTGPWQREKLVETWGEAITNKYVTAAKEAGWLVLPYRGTYYVPAARDLMLVSWLPEPARSEFLISRTLAAGELPYWCLSAWCRERGLDLGSPVFVTDLGASLDLGTGGARAPDRRALWTAAQDRAASRRPPPFLDHLIIVPALPALQGPRVRLVMTAEAKDAEGARLRTQVPGAGAIALAGLAVWALTKAEPNAKDPLEDLQAREANARGIPCTVGPEVSDDAWIVALLAALGTPRVEELVTQLRTGRKVPDASAIQRWAGLFGPPQPNAGWEDTIAKGPFPYFLVPPSLWSQMGADQAARRFRMLQRLGVG